MKSDLISRQAAINIAHELMIPMEEYHQYNQGVINYCFELSQLSSAQSEQRRGRFIGTEYDGYADGYPVYCEWKCSECGCVFEDEEPVYNFCPNCGADMRGEQDE
jgi:rubrerythrin